MTSVRPTLSASHTNFSPFEAANLSPAPSRLLKKEVP